MSNTTIQLRHSTETGNVPVSLANGEIAINTQDGKLFYADPTGTVQEFSGFPGPSGLDTEIQFNDSGVLGANSRLTFNKTTGTLTVNGSVVANVFSDDGTNLLVFANNAYNHANAAFEAANSSGGLEVTISTFNTTANGSANTFDVGFNPISAETILVTIDGVVQPESTYSVNTTSNTVTFVTTPLNDEAIRVINFYTDACTNLYIIADGSVTTPKIADSAVTPQKLSTTTNDYILDTSVQMAIALS